MSQPALDVESEFELMVRYSTTLQSLSHLIAHAPEDQNTHGLYEIVEPYPTYEEYKEGNDFVEGDLIEQSSDIVRLTNLQNSRRLAATV